MEYLNGGMDEATLLSMNNKNALSSFTFLFTKVILHIVRLKESDMTKELPEEVKKIVHKFANDQLKYKFVPKTFDEKQLTNKNIQKKILNALIVIAGMYNFEQKQELLNMLQELSKQEIKDFEAIYARMRQSEKEDLESLLADEELRKTINFVMHTVQISPDVSLEDTLRAIDEVLFSIFELKADIEEAINNIDNIIETSKSFEDSLLNSICDLESRLENTNNISELDRQNIESLLNSTRTIFNDNSAISSSAKLIKNQLENDILEINADEKVLLGMCKKAIENPNSKENLNILQERIKSTKKRIVEKKEALSSKVTEIKKLEEKFLKLSIQYENLFNEEYNIDNKEHFISHTGQDNLDENLKLIEIEMKEIKTRMDQLANEGNPSLKTKAQSLINAKHQEVKPRQNNGNQPTGNSMFFSNRNPLNNDASGSDKFNLNNSKSNKTAQQDGPKNPRSPGRRD